MIIEHSHMHRDAHTALKYIWLFNSIKLCILTQLEKAVYEIQEARSSNGAFASFNVCITVFLPIYTLLAGKYTCIVNV